MTDKELKDAAVAELRLTTVGWNKVKNYSAAQLATTHWGKAMNLLGQIGGAAPPSPPPPSTTTPWPNYRYADPWDTTFPNRHFAYQADGSLSLTCFADSPLLGTDRQLVSAYLIEGGAQAVEGRRVRYETRMTFPSDFAGTSGEVNFWFEWHTTTGQGAGQYSCAIGGYCDYPLDKNPGRNLRWFFRPIGPGASPPYSEMIGPPIQVGRSYDVRVDVKWSSTMGEFHVWLDGVQLRNWNLPTLWSGDNPSLGVYNYRLAVPFASTLNFTKPVVTIVGG